MASSYVATTLPLSDLDREAIKLAALVSGFPTIQGACWAAQRNDWRWIQKVERGRIVAVWHVTAGFAKPVDLSQPIAGRRQLGLGF